ncbi:sugar ABC transporter permease [Streptomyces sp. CT34]|uniref:carbohydrate ABC transporter permease n=1 Tax=Streptomyces sp. CT34 TaxID=1553907 RepID=UPI0007C7763F|nr:sugar ABC transporter permease [Streptomyces sp. CT34]
MMLTQPPAVESSTAQQGTRRRLPVAAGLATRWDQRFTPYAFVAPFFVLFAVFGLYPLLWTAWISLHHTILERVDETGSYVGFQYFAGLWHDEFFWNALRNTLSIGLLSAVPQLLLALGIAHLLNYRLRGSTFWRVAVLLPFATSIAAATLVFAQLYNRDYGMVNYVLHHWFGMKNIDFQDRRWPGQIAIATIIMWRWTGYNALIYLASMQSIPSELYEAAAIDGAGRWRQFRHVTIPALRPTIIFTVIVSTIGSLQIFGEPYLFAPGNKVSGGPNRDYQTLSMYFYERGFTDQNLGRAAAIAWAMLLVILVFVVINALIARRMKDSE